MPNTAAAPDAALDAHLDATKVARLESYKEFLRIPSISAIPEHAADCRAAARWLADALTTAGLEHVEVAETGGHPVVYADWLHAPDAPTVLVYGHYDVQPVDPLDLWTSTPFEPIVVGDRILARGAADDKGQIHAHVMAAAALLATRGAMPVNVRYVFEGEEESSSVHLDAWLEANRDRLTADVAIISDTGFFEGNIPAITLSLRGIMYAQIDVVGTRRRPPLGRLRRRRREPGQRPGPDHRRPQGTRRPDPDPGLLRRRRGPARRRIARPSPRSRSTRTSIWRDSGCRRSSARPATRPSSDGRSGRRSTSTGSGAASRARGARRSSRPTPTPRSAAGWSRTRTPTGSSRRSGRTSARSHRPASRRRSGTSVAAIRA